MIEQRFEKHKAELNKWIKTAEIHLDKNTDQNIGVLHEKVSILRDWSNKIKNQLLDIHDMLDDIRKEHFYNETAYQDYQSNFVPDEGYKALKTKEERSDYIRVKSGDLSKKLRESSYYVERIEAYLKKVQVVEFHLNYARKDVESQIAILKQQAYSGEVKPGKAFENLPSRLMELLNEGDQDSSLPDFTP